MQAIPTTRVDAQAAFVCARFLGTRLLCSKLEDHLDIHAASKKINLEMGFSQHAVLLDDLDHGEQSVIGKKQPLYGWAMNRLSHNFSCGSSSLDGFHYRFLSEPAEVNNAAKEGCGG